MSLYFSPRDNVSQYVILTVGAVYIAVGNFFTINGTVFVVGICTVRQWEPTGVACSPRGGRSNDIWASLVIDTGSMQLTAQDELHIVTVCHLHFIWRLKQFAEIRISC